LNASEMGQRNYRVFGFGHGHAALISEPLDRDDAKERRWVWQQSMPDAEIRIEKVGADGWPTSLFYLETSKFGLEGFSTIDAAAARAAFLARHFPGMPVSLANNSREKQSALGLAVAGVLAGVKHA
jgi:hypothetical protein